MIQPVVLDATYPLSRFDMKLVEDRSKQRCSIPCSVRMFLTSLLYRSGNKKKTKNLQNEIKIDEPYANQGSEEDLEEQAKSTKKKRPSDRPSRADAQVSTKETKLKPHVFVNRFQFLPSL